MHSERDTWCMTVLSTDGRPLTLDTLNHNHKNFKKWLVFHNENPKIYDDLVAIAKEAIKSNHVYWGMQGIFEILRWENRYLEVDIDGFRINNDYRSFYSRLIMENEPDLAGFFEIRTRRK